jgi:hypothetical protein
MSVTWQAMTFDCADAASLAGFWSQVLEQPVGEGATPEQASIASGQHGPHWYFIQVPEGKTVKNRVHPDLTAPDLPSEVERLTRLGATAQAEHEEGGFRWVTLRDPEGNEFDVLAESS